jgi:cobalt/nickel transport system permease protein
MAKIESAFFDIGYMDTLSAQETPLHQLDPRAKLFTTLIFTVAVVSFGKYEISAFFPFFIYPVALIAMGNIPVGFLLKKLLIVAPFAFLIGIFNPIMDREILMQLGPVGISGGWVSFFSILIRFALTVGAALVLVASTGFNAVCLALEKMGAPRVFTVQLLFMYRYLYVLIDEALRMARARSLRSFNGEGMGLKVFGSLAGHLLMRTLDRAQRIHLAMYCRGFDGEIRLMRPLKAGRAEIIYVTTWSAFFVLMRRYDVPQIMGKWITEIVL